MQTASKPHLGPNVGEEMDSDEEGPESSWWTKVATGRKCTPGMPSSPPNRNRHRPGPALLPQQRAPSLSGSRPRGGRGDLDLLLLGDLHPEEGFSEAKWAMV